MVLFLTQYYRGIGHANRIRLLAEEVGKNTECVVVDQLFKPPLEFVNATHYALLHDYKVKDIKKIFHFIQQKELIRFRIRRWKEILDQHKPKVIVVEGFPFCRHQFAFEYFTYLKEAKKRNIKILCSIRDYPWDEPHEAGLQDWVANTQNLAIQMYFDKILVHGDRDIMPLLSDRVRIENTSEIIDELEEYITYTGYVVDKKLKKHERKNNTVYVSCGLNKEEVLLIFKQVIKAAEKFPDLSFIMPMANDYMEKLRNTTKRNVTLTDYIDNLSSKISDCALFITYGGYNSTMEILQTQCPAIIIPRQNGQKLEQFIRAYAFEPLNVFKVCSPNELNNLHKVIDEAQKDKSFPSKFKYNMSGVENSAKEIFKYFT
jgi:predicted glycosyltransferase